ncbi:nitrogenase component 1 [Eubacterium oxidoreducens]|uniref:Nitrogenase molybdenum-iron protein alpha chain n=1 Tax=Eubacterium oxidoreducens TaxID=1732 RepID=A0A1G6C2C1_EUBOX|nr:nitrogenase component 1 [Eubacterium oxidoreducens]SDB27004.1 nitrogenase molybdenum-iron protein alpha chain [Eubacterium oxidoreducens]
MSIEKKSTINLSLPAVEIREVRTNSITGYDGKAKDLVEQSHSGGLKDIKRSFQQCAGCSIEKAACMTVLIQDAAVIEHGPIGCSTCFHEYNFTYSVNADLRGVAHPTQRKVFSTNLQEKDTVYGGVQKLANTIRDVYKRTHASVIFVLSTCAAAIIGDDIESTCDEAEDELGIPIVPIVCEGFRSRVWTTGFDAAYHGIARKLIDKPAKRRNDVINVINFWGSDRFSDWFAPFGCKPNYITPYATVNTLRKSGEAAATVQACSTLGSYLAAVLEKEFGVPEIETAPPYGIAQTDRWFRALGKILHKEDVAEEIIAQKKEKYLPKIEALREKLKGKTAYVTGGAAHGQALLAVLGELGVNAVGASIFHHDAIYDSGRQEDDQLKKAVEDYGDISNYRVCSKQEYELANSLGKLRPDVLLARHGGMTLWGAKYGIPSLLVGDEHLSMGYEGIIDYGERILDTIENDEFVRNLQKHAINPYTKWWLMQRPDYFFEK